MNMSIQLVCRIIIKYKLKSGKTITRQYRRGEVPVSQEENVKNLVVNDLTMITKIRLNICQVVIFWICKKADIAVRIKI